MKDNWTLDSKTEYVDACITQFQVKSTGYVGGDSSKTQLVFKDIGATNMLSKAIGTCSTFSDDIQTDKLTITLYGDAEIRNFKKGLQFILDNLNTLGE